MPFFLAIVGIVFIVSGVRGTNDELFKLLKGDFKSEPGKPSFLAWLLAVLIIGSLGYIEPIRPISRAFLVLIIVVLFLSNGGFFKKFSESTK